MVFKKIARYLNPLTMLEKGENKNFNLKMMHGINRISIFMFLICIIIMLVKFVF